MPKIKLTNTFTKKIVLTKDKSKIDYFDTEVIGFMLEVRTTTKTFYFRYSKNSKRTMKKLGYTTTLSANEARKLCLKMKKAIETDSLEQIFYKKTTTPTLLKFYNDHYLSYAKLHSNTWKKNESIFRLHILPALGDITMDKITSPMISKAHLEMKTKKQLSNGSANKFIVFTKHCFNIAIDMKVEGITENPATKLKQLEEPHREKYLTNDEAKRLMKAINESRNKLLKYIVRFLILTGARKTEVLRAKWEDIDYPTGLWTIPITKSKKIRKIPISKELQELFNEIPKTSIYLFPALKKEGHTTTVNDAFNHARKKAALDDLRLHDLRHSFASQLVNSGRSLYEVQKLLGHSNSKMTQRYAHLSDESLLQAASCAGGLLK